jgi:ABC-2 type transport system permease protein
VNRPGTLTAYRWELRKLVAQKRTYLGFGIAMLVPLAFVIALALRSGEPRDVAFGTYVHQSGLAIPLVILTFTAGFMFPLVTALVSGDIVAAEDHNGTLKTILTRSLDRGQVFSGKALAAVTYGLAALVLMFAVATIAGSIVSGFHSLTSLSGTRVGAWTALGLVAASFGVFFLPALAVVAIGLLLSTATRNSTAGVVSTLMVLIVLNLIAILPGLGGLSPYLLPDQFNAWMGFLREPIDWAPIVRSVWVCAAFALPCVFAGYLVFLRRDVAGS